MNPGEKLADVVRPKSKRMHWPTTTTGMSAVGFAQVGLFFIVLLYVLHEIKPVLMPLVLGILASMIVHPVYMLFRKFRIPRMLASAITVFGLLTILSIGAYQAILPATDWLRNMNEDHVLGRVREVFRPMKVAQAEITEMANRVDKATNEAAPPVEVIENAPEKAGEGTAKKFGDVAKEITATDSRVAIEVDSSAGKVGSTEEPLAAEPVMVEIHEDPIGTVMEEVKAFGVSFISFVLMVFFLLAYGNRVVRQLNRDPNLEALLSRIGTDVSKYMFTITAINAALGVCISLAMWGLGMPRPILWGVMGMVLNFIPYVGAFSGTIVIFLAAAINYEQPGMVIAVPAIYFALTAIEGNFVTPTILGGRFNINPLVVFVWIFAWGGFWGVAGILIAMPALVIFKIVCERTEKMKYIARLLVV